MCQNTSIPVAQGLRSPAAQRMFMFMCACMCMCMCVIVCLRSCGYNRKRCSGLLGHGSRSLGLSTVISSSMVITYCKNKHHYLLVLPLLYCNLYTKKSSRPSKHSGSRTVTEKEYVDFFLYPCTRLRGYAL